MTVSVGMEAKRSVIVGILYPAAFLNHRKICIDHPLYVVVLSDVIDHGVADFLTEGFISVTI